MPYVVLLKCHIFNFQHLTILEAEIYILYEMYRLAHDARFFQFHLEH